MCSSFTHVKYIVHFCLSVAVLSDDGSLFTCGNNCNGQLGLNHYNNIATFTRVSLPAVILQASAGWDFTVILSGKGVLSKTFVDFN